MGWETRRDSQNRYYTRSRKRFGRVEREYVGSGPVALLGAKCDDLSRREIAEERRLWRENESRRLKYYREWKILIADFSAFEISILENLGFHIHHGQLRYRRMTQLHANPIWSTIRKANLGDEQALIQLREELCGSNRELMLEHVGDLARQCEMSALSSERKNHPGLELIVREKMNALRSELAPTNAIESLIVERIVQCWLQLHLTEMDGLSLATPSKAIENRIDALNRRYLQSLRTLATVRKGLARVTRQVTTTIELANIPSVSSSILS